VVLNLSGSGPLFQQIYRALRDAILAGRVRAIRCRRPDPWRATSPSRETWC